MQSRSASVRTIARRCLVGAAFAGLLVGCDTALGTGTTRAAAKTVVNSVIESRFPGAPVAPVTDCIIDNASGSEIVQIAADASQGTITETSAALVLEIATRPDAIRCFVEDAGPTVAAVLIAVARVRPANPSA